MARVGRDLVEEEGPRAVVQVEARLFEAVLVRDPGDRLVGVGVEGEGDDAKFTFQGTKKEPEPATVPAHAAGSDLEGPDHIAGLGGGGHASGAAPEGGAAAES